MQSFYDIIYGTSGEKLDFHLPNGRIDSIFLFFHGGGLEFGSKDPNMPIIPYLTNHAVAVVDVNYRMYPDAVFPEFIEDAAEAVHWVFQNKHRFGGCERIFVGGSSAGGYISMMLCFDKRYLAKYSICPTDLTGYVHNAGQPTAHFRVLQERGLDSRRLIVDETAPLYYVGLDGNDCSPMLFLVSDQDMENRLEQTKLMLSTLKHFRYPRENIHFQLLQGTHCSHDGSLDADGNSVFGKLILDFLQTV